MRAPKQPPLASLVAGVSLLTLPAIVTRQCESLGGRQPNFAKATANTRKMTSKGKPVNPFAARIIPKPRAQPIPDMTATAARNRMKGPYSSAPSNFKLRFQARVCVRQLTVIRLSAQIPATLVKITGLRLPGRAVAVPLRNARHAPVVNCDDFTGGAVRKSTSDGCERNQTSAAAPQAPKTSTQSVNTRIIPVCFLKL